MTVEKHLHKLKRHTHATGSQIYFCVNDCSYRISVELSLGKVSECWRCGKAFSMNVYSQTLAKPHCENCHSFKSEANAKARGRVVKPLTQVANLAAESVVESLADRLHNLTSNIPIAETKSAEIKEFKLEDEEDFI